MPQLTIQQAFDLAVRHHKAGRLQEAEQIYRQILARQPTHIDAMHLLGVIAHQAGRHDIAVDLIRRAIALSPNFPDAYNNLGNALLAKGQLDEAIAAYRQAITRSPNYAQALSNLGNALRNKGQLDEAIAVCRQVIALDPNLPEAHYNLGNALKDHGQLDQAIAAYRQAIILRPNFPDAHNNLGNALRDTRQLDQAIAAYRQAISLRPDYAQAHSNLGIALKDTGQLDEAIAACRHAIALQPDFAEGHSNLGNALNEKRQPDEAITAFRHAIAVKPDFPEGHNNLANALKDKGQLDNAIAAYRRAIALKPDYAEAHSNLGNALRDKGQLDEAIDACRRAIALNPNLPEAHSNLGNALNDKGQLEVAIAAFRRAIALDPSLPEAPYNLGNALNEKGELDVAIDAYREALALNPNYAQAHNNLANALKDKGQLDEAIAAYRQAISIDPDNTIIDSNLVYTLHFHPAYDAWDFAQEHRRWNRQHAEPLRKFVQPHSNDANPERRLRIGYVSPDFRSHAVGRFLLPLLEHHDKNHVQVFAYAHVPVSDALTQRLRSYTDRWRDISGLSDTQAADLIRQDQIDILVDLTMHMANNRLLIFARKPAPVQVTYLAYCSSTGLNTIDYRLSDPYLDPPGVEESFYSEQTIRLPDTYWCYQPFDASVENTPLPALARGAITFGCLNNFCKVSQPTLGAWAKVLQAVPNSQLLLSAHEGSHRLRLWKHLEAEGIEPQRVRFAGRMPLPDYFQLYDGIDIALDTFPYAGGTTTCDALWMGVPLVSLVGNTAVGRGGLSILSNIGLGELLAHSEPEYVRLASELANDVPLLNHLRSTLRHRMEQSPLMDAPKFARNIEAAYRKMWRTWCQRS